MGNRRNLTREIGSTGLDPTRWGYIQDDFLREWNGAEKIKRIDEMIRNSPVIGALRLAIEMPIRDIDWQVVSDDGEDDPRIELVNESLENMSYTWQDHIIDALLLVFYGWSKFTINYERVNGRILWHKLKILGHDTVQRWLIDESGGIQGVQQWPHLWSDPIPIERLILYRFRKTKNNPEGESVLRPAWIPYYYVKNLQQIEAISLERRGAGLPMVTPPMGADMSDGSTDRTKAEQIVRNVRQDEQAGITLPPPTGEGEHMRWHFELLSAPNTSTLDYDKTIARYEKRILMSALAQFLMLGMDNVGAMATFEGATDFFTMSINATADNIAETFTKYGIARLLKLNGYDPAGVRIEHSPAGNLDLNAINAFLAASGSLITFTDKDEAWLRSIFRMPEMDTAESHPTPLRRVEEDEEADAMHAELYAAPIVPDNHPNDDELQKLERKWYSTARNYFNDQFERVIKAAQ